MASCRDAFDSRSLATDTTRMRTRIMFAVAVATALICPAAHAEDWRSLCKSSDDHPTEIFIDMSSVVLKDNIRIAKTKHVALLPWRDNTQPFNHAVWGIQRVSIDCNAGLIQVGGIELHSAGGRIAGFLDVEQSWKPAEDSLTKKMFDFVCEWNPTTNSKKED
jgi:hypothetical protein